MKILFNIAIASGLISCDLNSEINQEIQKVQTNPVEIYRSTTDSFQKDFFLKIEGDSVTIYGWEITFENDTIYYRSQSSFQKNNNDSLNISLDSLEWSTIKTNATNLNDFIINTEPDYPILLAHNRFFGNKQADGSFHFLATKHIYDSRADEFTFEKIR